MRLNLRWCLRGLRSGFRPVAVRTHPVILGHPAHHERGRHDRQCHERAERGVSAPPVPSVHYERHGYRRDHPGQRHAYRADGQRPTALRDEPFGHSCVDHQRTEQRPACEPRYRVKSEEYQEVGLQAQTDETNRRHCGSEQHQRPRAVAVHHLARHDTGERASGCRECCSQRELPYLPAQLDDDGSQEHADDCGSDSHPRELAHESAGDDPPAVETAF